MPFSLLKLAESEGIKVEYWDFAQPLEAVYMSLKGSPPVIGLSRTLFSCPAYFRCVLAEELGHHFTSTGNSIPRSYYRYSDRLFISRVEYRALRWAAIYLISLDTLIDANKQGYHRLHELADYYNVTEDMIKFRFSLPDFCEYKLRYMV